jgi:WD40-like Beta Propeller Repeat
LDEPTAGTDRATIPRRFGHLSFRLTPVRLVALTVVALIAGLYIWGIFFYGDETEEGSIKIEWLQADPLAPTSPENPRPFSGSVPPGEDVWQAFVVTEGGEPRLLHESHRLLASTRWTQDNEHVVLSAFSRSVAGQPMTGIIGVDPVRRSVLWERLFLSSAGAGLGGSSERLAMLQPRSGAASTPAQGPGQFAGSSLDLYLIEPDGLSRRLSTPWSHYQITSWSPDGQHLLIGASSLGSPVPQTSGLSPRWSDYYVLTPYEGHVIFVGRLDPVPAWSPDGTRIAGVAGSEIVIFDKGKEETTRVHLGETMPAQSPPGQFGPGVIALRWSQSSSHLGYRGAVIEVASGRLVADPQPGILTTTPSPDAKWAVLSGDYAACGPVNPRERPVPKNRTFLHEVSSGHTLQLLDCEDGSSTFHQWLSADSVLIGNQTCIDDCSRGFATRLLLARASTGRVELLAEQASTGASWAISPDGRQILVGGSSLRLFSSDGVLLKTIAAPEGLTVGAVSWSQDGRSFAYAVGPSMQRVFPSQPAPMPFP